MLIIYLSISASQPLPLCLASPAPDSLPEFHSPPKNPTFYFLPSYRLFNSLLDQSEGDGDVYNTLKQVMPAFPACIICIPGLNSGHQTWKEPSCSPLPMFCSFLRSLGALSWGSCWYSCKDCHCLKAQRGAQLTNRSSEFEQWSKVKGIEAILAKQITCNVLLVLVLMVRWGNGTTASMQNLT